MLFIFSDMGGEDTELSASEDAMSTSEQLTWTDDGAEAGPTIQEAD